MAKQKTRVSPLQELIDKFLERNRQADQVFRGLQGSQQTPLARLLRSGSVRGKRSLDPNFDAQGTSLLQFLKEQAPAFGQESIDPPPGTPPLTFPEIIPNVGAFPAIRPPGQSDILPPALPPPNVGAFPSIRPPEQSNTLPPRQSKDKRAKARNIFPF